MTIQWFPGHMQETELFLRETISNIDVILEILDARLPVSSSNSFLDKICQNVLRIKVLNKQDLADPVYNKLWLDYFNDSDRTGDKSTLKSIAITGTDYNEAWSAIELALSNLPITQSSKTKSRKLRIMVAGIPNTGKSTIMNTLAGKKVAKTGNVPAITKHQQRTAIKNHIDIYDTPGILPPVFKNQERAYRLAASGAISDSVIDYNEIAIFALKYLMLKYPDLLKDRYEIYDFDGIKFEENGNGTDKSSLILEKIGFKRGCLKKGGIVDLQKASELLIRELRAGKIGRISFESPEDYL